MRYLVMFSALTLMSLASTLSVATAGPIGLSGFGSGAVTTTFDDLDLPFNNPPPLVVDGHTFVTSFPNITYFTPFSGSGCDADCIATGFDVDTIDIELVELSLRAGVDVVSFLPGATGMAEFYDQANSLLGTVAFSIGSFTSGFVGWEADSGFISRISMIFTSDNGAVEGIDNLIYELAQTVPAPGAMALLGVGLIGLVMRRRTA